MDGVNKTLYIPLFGKAYVSRRGLFLEDRKAEEIWEAEKFPLKAKSASKWLAFYMGIRSAVFDEWVKQQLADYPDAAVIQIGCGMDSRVLRVGAGKRWYDVDFAEVMEERKRYYRESAGYRMLAGNAADEAWLAGIPERSRAVVVMEGMSMYLTPRELHRLFRNLGAHFEEIVLLMDCYTVFAAKMSKYKNPVNDVGVTQVYGMDDPESASDGGLHFVHEHTMTPQKYIDELRGGEKFVFRKLYAGGFSKKLYRLFEYRKN